jgi:hypothetical protein
MIKYISLTSCIEDDKSLKQIYIYLCQGRRDICFFFFYFSYFSIISMQRKKNFTDISEIYPIPHKFNESKRTKVIFKSYYSIIK